MWATNVGCTTALQLWKGGVVAGDMHLPAAITTEGVLTSVSRDPLASRPGAAMLTGDLIKPVEDPLPLGAAYRLHRVKGSEPAQNQGRAETAEGEQGHLKEPQNRHRSSVPLTGSVPTQISGAWTRSSRAAPPQGGADEPFPNQVTPEPSPGLLPEHGLISRMTRH